MGFFDKFKNKSKIEKKKNEHNEIDNKELKETIANTALATLKKDEDYKILANTTVQFGYLFIIDGHGIEALFKVITDKGILYFAAQKDSVLRVNIDEELFNDTTENFLEMHG
jgi:hypothetical protein